MEINTPAVSIVIPTFNSWDYLKEMIGCHLKQTFVNWQLIIVDDRSEDGTSEYIREYLEDKRIVYTIRDTSLPKGAQTCRNLGLNMAEGKYVCFFDADDLIPYDCLARRVHYMESHPHLDFAVFPAQVFSGSNGNYVCHKNWWFGDCAFSRRETISRFLQNFYPFAVWTNIYRTDSIRQFKWDTEVALFQDFDYNMSLLFAGKSFAYSSEKKATYFYRSDASPNSTAANYNTEKKFCSTMRLFRKTLARIDASSAPRRFKKDYFLYIFFILMRFEDYGDSGKVNEVLNFIEENYSISSRRRAAFIGKALSGNNLPFNKKKIIGSVLAAAIFADSRFLKPYFSSVRKLINGSRGFAPFSLS